VVLYAGQEPTLYSAKVRLGERGRSVEVSTRLWVLLALFTLRVAGQLGVVLHLAPFLPPMDQWQSGVLPYPVLLASQLVILAGLGTVCLQFSRGHGYFVRPHQWLARPLLFVGWMYAASMIVRYAIWMTIRPDQRWTGDLIPVVFHLVLAGFLISIAQYHLWRTSQCADSSSSS